MQCESIDCDVSQFDVCELCNSKAFILIHFKSNVYLIFSISIHFDVFEFNYVCELYILKAFILIHFKSIGIWSFRFRCILMYLNMTYVNYSICEHSFF